MTPQSAYLYHSVFERHDMGVGHPEQPDRVRVVHRALTQSGLLNQMHSFEAPKASNAALARAHSENYVHALAQASPAQGLRALDPDTSMNPFTFEAAVHAAGALVKATDLVLAEGFQRAFCNVRPPGHHATRDTAMGFCFFNNVAVGAHHALAQYGLKRIAVIDFDVHHGNGTENIFANEPRVAMVSTFQSQLYPGSGQDPLGPQMHNVGLPANSDGGALRRAVSETWLTALDEFSPELIYISAGFDAHVEDDMSQLRWVDQDYAWVTEQIVALANRHSQGRIISALEGGYALPALGRSAVEHVRVLTASTNKNG
jgi:acetoin utilization deacetylase AcuC-like enzyme